MDRIHFIGIGGAGMSAIARVMRARGAEISGSDSKRSATTERFASEGVRVAIGHDPANVEGASLVVYTAALSDDNPELLAASRLRIPAVGRAEMLGRLMAQYKHRVAVTGTHGKTTTTSMISLVLTEAGLDPTVLIGGDLAAIGGNARVGGGPMFVTEACEAFGSFLHLRPSIAVITNIDADHLDHYGTLDNILESFERFIDLVDKDGCVIACEDDENVRKVLRGAARRVEGYSLDGQGGVRAEDVAVDSPHAAYDLVHNGRRLGRVTLGVPGLQNVANSLAAASVGFELGASFEAIKSALAKFTGTGRRFEILGNCGDILVVDDYAHHPREIRATLAAARSAWNRRIIAVFQPHLYSRTEIFAKEFAESLSSADLVVVTDIYAAREKPIDGVTSKLILDEMRGVDAHHIPDKPAILDFLLSRVRPGDMVLTLGAGDIRTVGEDLVDALSGKRPEATQTGIKA
ncbi:MAG: UDP-N-acetylmuramate--L-alanine ligase [Armatimonadetes bacterium]|nr:UDP-N-acetylmuramate--L-alanine ligase [Armatimonadota bacterium]